MNATIIEALIKVGVMIGGMMTAAAYFVLLERRMADEVDVHWVVSFFSWSFQSSSSRASAQPTATPTNKTAAIITMNDKTFEKLRMALNQSNSSILFEFGDRINAFWIGESPLRQIDDLGIAGAFRQRFKQRLN